jgi:hypothetical protein
MINMKANDKRCDKKIRIPLYRDNNNMDQRIGRQWREVRNEGNG